MISPAAPVSTQCSCFSNLPPTCYVPILMYSVKKSPCRTWARLIVTRLNSGHVTFNSASRTSSHDSCGRMRPILQERLAYVRSKSRFGIMVIIYPLNEILCQYRRPRLAFFLPCCWQLLRVEMAHPPMGKEAFRAFVDGWRGEREHLSLDNFHESPFPILQQPKTAKVPLIEKKKTKRRSIWQKGWWMVVLADLE